MTGVNDVHVNPNRLVVFGLTETTNLRLSFENHCIPAKMYWELLVPPKRKVAASWFLPLTNLMLVSVGPHQFFPMEKFEKQYHHYYVLDPSWRRLWNLDGPSASWYMD